MTILVLSRNQRLFSEIERRFSVEHGRVILTTTADSALKAAQRVALDCAVIDFQGPRAVATIGRMRELDGTVPILAIGNCGTSEDRMRTLQAGADDCIPDPVSVQELVMRIRLLLHRSALTRRVGLGGRWVAVAETYKLSPAESKVAKQLVEGKSLAQISAELGVTEHTIRSQLKAIFHKTGVRRQAELVWLLMTSMAKKPEQDSDPSGKRRRRFPSSAA